MVLGTYGERARGIASSRPTPATIETETLVTDNLENATALKGLGVRLALDLQDIERQEDNLADADQTRGSSSAVPAIAAKTCSRCQTHLPAVECMIALPVFFPNADSKSLE